MRLLRCLLVAVLLASLQTPVRAADEDSEKDPAAQELVQQGILLRRSGKDEAALGAFLEAERRAPNSVRVLLHVTTAAQATGRWLMAYEYLQKASAYRTDPYYLRYRASIKTIEDTVAQRVGQFRVLGSPAGAQVLLNGEVVASLPMASPKVVEVGSYVLEVRYPGYYALRRPVTILGGAALAQEAVELKREDASASLSPDRRTAKHAGSSQNLPQSAKPPLKRRWITWTLAGTGVALAATSGVAFAIREGAANHWNDDRRCLSGTRTREQVCGGVQGDAKSAERVGIVTGALALGFGGASLAHWLWTSDTDREKEAFGLRAGCDAGLGSILCHGTF